MSISLDRNDFSALLRTGRPFQNRGGKRFIGLVGISILYESITGAGRAG
jgi:hypothetical protein